MNDVQITGIIRNARKFTFQNGSIYTGNLYNDSKGRWCDGAEVRTSLVVKEEGDLVYTLNSIYRLVNE